ncbi:hypothetical protein KCP78_16175 [Salmonella enterica subsp. enterica]|nr:hypothetical protein KCP78_16175 [Salmonella enterica subsp. enterica]
MYRSIAFHLRAYWLRSFIDAISTSFSLERFDLYRFFCQQSGEQWSAARRFWRRKL